MNAFVRLENWVREKPGRDWSIERVLIHGVVPEIHITVSEGSARLTHGWSPKELCQTLDGESGPFLVFDHAADFLIRCFEEGAGRSKAA